MRSSSAARIVRLIESKGSGDDLVPTVGAFIRELKDAVRQRSGADESRLAGS